MDAAARLLREHGPAAVTTRGVAEAAGLQAPAIYRGAGIGQLRVSDQRAVDLLQAAGTGVIQTLLSAAPDRRDNRLGDAMYDTVLATILTDVVRRPDDEVLSAAVAVRASLAGSDTLSDAEGRLMSEWLDRIIAARRD